MNKFLNDPLAHFLAAGAVLFVIISALTPPENEDRIIVDREALLSFIQYRSKAFEPAVAAKILDEMTPEARALLIDDYIREEALYREAKKLGFGENDYVIRQRMVQKADFLTDAAAPSAAPDQATLQSFFAEHLIDYQAPPSATLSHVFISSEDRSEEETMALTTALLSELKDANAGFEDATQYGERFLFHTNYVDRTFDYIRSHFGDEATAIIFSGETPKEEWVGPLETKYGLHLVFVSDRKESRTPSFDEVRAKVTEDYQATLQRERKEKLIADVVSDYDVIIEPGIAKSSK